MDLAAVNDRVDKALADNRRAESVIVGMTAAIFLLGVAVVVIAYWRMDPYLGTGALLLQGLIYWPVKKVLALRRENLLLQTLPVLVSMLPPKEAAQAISKALFERLWDGKD
jgi:hypothetical protein